MTKVVIILTEDGTFENVLTDSEVDVKILKRGTDDARIDRAEVDMEVAE